MVLWVALDSPGNFFVPNFKGMPECLVMILHSVNFFVISMPQIHYNSSPGREAYLFCLLPLKELYLKRSPSLEKEKNMRTKCERRNMMRIRRAIRPGDAPSSAQKHGEDRCQKCAVRTICSEVKGKGICFGRSRKNRKRGCDCASGEWVML